MIWSKRLSKDKRSRQDAVKQFLSTSELWLLTFIHLLEIWTCSTTYRTLGASGSKSSSSMSSLTLFVRLGTKLSVSPWFFEVSETFLQSLMLSACSRRVTSRYEQITAPRTLSQSQRLREYKFSRCTWKGLFLEVQDHAGAHIS